MTTTGDAAIVNGGDVNDSFAWGIDAIAETIERTPRQAYHLISSGQLKSVRKLGGRWVAHRRALRAECGAGAAR
jgi:hypothetical protein